MTQEDLDDIDRIQREIEEAGHIFARIRENLVKKLNFYLNNCDHTDAKGDHTFTDVRAIYSNSQRVVCCAICGTTEDLAKFIQETRDANGSDINSHNDNDSDSQDVQNLEMESRSKK